MNKNHGFVAGTLVHTDKGLAPIQEIKVGDLVLSKAENDQNAPNEYKRVLNTFKSKEKLFYVTYAVEDIDGYSRTKYIFCTEDHPFWIKDYSDAVSLEDFANYKDIGWRPAQEINGALEQAFETYSGIPLVSSDFGSSFGREKTVICTENPLVAMLYDDDFSCYLDLREGLPVVVAGGGVYLSCGILEQVLASTQAKRILTDDKNDPEVQFFAPLKPTWDDYYTNVYSIAVEDFHTYFVGEEGIWVHQ